MNDPKEPIAIRQDAEADVREHAITGMLPTNSSGKEIPRALVLGACLRIRRELDFEISPQQIRFTEMELRFLIAAAEMVEFGDNAIIQSTLGKLRHREKTMRNVRNQDRKA